jgi:hypothetical protein
MCAEKEPLDCHRTLLVARKLAALNIPITHILADGRVESQEQAMRRLIEMYEGAQGNLFSTFEEQVDSACARQERRIAYTPKPGAAVPTGDNT